MNWYETKNGQVFIRKQIFINFWQEEIDWVAKNCLQVRSLNDSTRTRAINQMMAAFLKNPKENGTWIIDIRKKYRSLIYDREAHYFIPNEYLIYSGNLFEFSR